MLTFVSCARVGLYVTFNRTSHSGRRKRTEFRLRIATWTTWSTRRESRLLSKRCNKTSSAGEITRSKV